MKKILLLLLNACLILPGFAQQAASPLWGKLSPGTYPVGFFTKWLIDHTRIYQDTDTLEMGSLGRPLRLLVWYPGKPVKSKPYLNFGDYLDVKPTSATFEKWNVILKTKELNTAKRQFAQPALQDSLSKILFKTPTHAKSDLPRAKGKFPLVIHLLGSNDYQLESTTLWEYLASHGYLIIVIPQIGNHISKLSAPFSLETVERQAEDLAITLQFLKQSDLSQSIDFKKVGLIGHSLGGAVILKYLTQHQTDAVVFLDGAIQDKESKALLSNFTWQKGAISKGLLNLYAGFRKDMLEQPVFNTFSGTPQFHIAFQKATHFDFQQWPLYALLTQTDDPRGISFRSSREGADYYYAICDLVLQFLDYTLENEKSALPYLNGIKKPKSTIEEQLEFYPR